MFRICPLKISGFLKEAQYAVVNFTKNKLSNGREKIVLGNGW